MGFSEFMASPAGIAVFSVVAAAIVVFFFAVNYRYFAKNVLDFIFGLIVLIIVSPCIGVCAAVLKKKKGRAFTKVWVKGKGGSPVQVHLFEGGQNGDCGAITRAPLKFLPLFADVVAGRLSLVGPVPLSLADGVLMPQQYDGRFAVRPGILSGAHARFAERPGYEEMFVADAAYAKKHGLFSDIAAVFVWLFRLLRGEGYPLLASGRDGYAKSLLADGAILPEQYEEACIAAEEELVEFRRSKMRVGYPEGERTQDDEGQKEQ